MGGALFSLRQLLNHLSAVSRLAADGCIVAAPRTACISIPSSFIDEVLEFRALAGEEEAEVFQEEVRGAGDVLGVRARVVRRDEEPREVPEDAVAGQGLVGEDVERGPGDPSFAQSTDERGLFHQLAARDVDKAGGLLHPLQLLASDEAAGL